MATTKTLTPTNQAITLAAFTEKPDNRTNVTNDDKLADAVNALNSNTPKLTVVDQNLPVGSDYTVTLTNGIYLLVTCKQLNTTIASSLHIIFANQYGSTLKTVTDAPNVSVTVNKLNVTLHTDTEYVKASFIQLSQ